MGLVNNFRCGTAFAQEQAQTATSNQRFKEVVMSFSIRVSGTVSIIAVFCLLLSSAPAVFAQAGAASISKSGSLTAGAQSHDGFFLRMTAGGGFHGVSGSGTAAGVRNPSGEQAGQGLSLALGGIVAPNLALYADFHLNGAAFMELDKAHFGNTMANIGVTYYVMPYNIYFSASVGWAAALFFVENEDGSAPHRSNFEDTYGVGLVASVGKEWWVSDNWGLGVALQGNYSYTRDSNIAFHQGGLMLHLSATYN